MTRWARGVNTNKKKEHAASSWNEMNRSDVVKQNTKDEKTPRECGQEQPTAHSHPDSDRVDSQADSSSAPNVHQHHSKKDRLHKTDRFPHQKWKKKPFYKDSGRVSGSVNYTDRTHDDEERLSLVWRKEKRSNLRRLRRMEERRANKVCFNCRKPGHNVSACPEVVADVEHGTGMCFKCGSTEHTAYSCKVKIPAGEFPYAKCFICGEKGHISKQCPDNPRGLYPNGGCCLHCGCVDHFKKDCPELQKQQGIEDMKIDTLQGAGSVEVESTVTQEKHKTKKKSKKVVKF